MPRRLAVAKQAGGFDALGWTLLGFLLGASLAVFALLHADISAITRPSAGAPSPPPVPVIRYTPPAPPTGLPLAGGARALPVDLVPTRATAPATSAPTGVSALASAGAASAHAAAKAEASPSIPKAPAPRNTAASAPATDAEVADDAAAAGMTSRAGAAPAQGQELY